MIPSNSRQLLSHFDEDIEERLEYLEEDIGMEFTEAFDNIKVTNIPESNVPARTRYRPGMFKGKTTLEIDKKDIEYLTDTQLDNLLVHEANHGFDFKGELDNQLGYLGLEQDTINEVTGLMRQNEAANEGIVQKFANTLTDETAGSIFRPEETRYVENLLEQREIDLEQEIDLAEGSIAPYPETEIERDIYEKVLSDNMYLEFGSYGEDDYVFMAVGEDASEYGEELIEDLFEEYGKIEEEIYDGSVSMSEAEEYFADQDACC